MFLPHILSLSLPLPSLNQLFFLLQTLFLIMIGLDVSFHSNLNFSVLSLEMRLTLISLFHSVLENDLIKKSLILWFAGWLVSSFRSLPISSMREAPCVNPFLLYSPCLYPFCWWMNEWTSMPEIKYTHKSYFRDRMASEWKEWFGTRSNETMLVLYVSLRDLKCMK